MVSCRLFTAVFSVALLLAGCDAFTTPALFPLRASPGSALTPLTRGLRATSPPVLRNPACTVPAMSTQEKQSPLEGGGLRGLEEEERRISTWRGRFELDDAQIKALRESFEAALKTSKGDLRAIDKTAMKSLIQKVSSSLDTADVDPNVLPTGGRPIITEDELNNYINALKPLWEETCGDDAVELANGECAVPLDTENFDLSEVVAVFGMCVRDHCGIGGVCFWDSA